MRRYRRGARFVACPLERSTPLDRNQRARLLYLAEALERRTKTTGRRNGVLGYVGLQILRALLLGFQNGRTGVCVPSYSAIQAATGLCRASIAEGLKRLATTGILTIVRRIERRRIVREGREIMSTVQGSNLYSFAEPRADADLIKPEPRRRSVPQCLKPMWQPFKPQLASLDRPPIQVGPVAASRALLAALQVQLKRG